MEFIEIMEKIGKNPEQLEKLLELKKFDEVYQLLKKNGYKKSPEMLRKDVEELITKGLMRLENAELSKVSGGGLKENITRATSLGMASLLMLGASPMSSQASAHGGFQGGGASVGAKVPTNFNKSANTKQGSSKLPFTSSVKKSNVAKIIGAVAALGVVGGLGYGGRVVQDKLSKPKQEPKIESEGEPNPNQNSTQEPKVEISEKKVFIDSEDFIEEHVAECTIFNRAKRKACFECIKNISEALGITGSKHLKDLTYGGYKVTDGKGLSSNEIGCFLCHVVTGYACGESVKSMTKFQECVFLSCLQSLTLFEAFAREFQDPQKHEKIKQCIGYLIDFYEKSNKEYDTSSNQNAIGYLKDALDFLPKFVVNNTFYNSAKLHEKFNEGEGACVLAAKLHQALEENKIDEDRIKSIKVLNNFDEQEYALGDIILDDLDVFVVHRIRKVIVECTEGKRYTFKWNYVDETFSLEDTDTQPATE